MTLKIKHSTDELVFDGINFTIITLITLICLYPMLYVLFASFSDPILLMNNQGPLLRPLGFSLEGYNVVLKNVNTWIGYKNTIFYVIVGTAINMAMTTLGAYALSRKNFMLRKFFTIFIVFTMYFSGGVIPNFLLVKNLGLLDTRWAVIIPVAVNTWNMLVLRTAFVSIPESLEEAARIDGANDFTLLFRIIVPVSKATMAVILLFYAVGHWNSWFNAMIYLPRSRDLFPMQLFLREILITSTSVSSDENQVNYLGELVKYTTIVVATLPILCLYPFLQKYFVKGVMMGSVKE